MRHLPMRVVIWVVSSNLLPVSSGPQPAENPHKRRPVRPRQARLMSCVGYHFCRSASSNDITDIVERVQRLSDKCRCCRGWCCYWSHELCKRQYTHYIYELTRFHRPLSPRSVNLSAFKSHTRSNLLHFLKPSNHNKVTSNFSCLFGESLFSSRYIISIAESSGQFCVRNTARSPRYARMDHCLSLHHFGLTFDPLSFPALTLWYVRFHSRITCSHTFIGYVQALHCVSMVVFPIKDSGKCQLSWV